MTVEFWDKQAVTACMEQAARLMIQLNETKKQIAALRAGLSAVDGDSPGWEALADKFIDENAALREQLDEARAVIRELLRDTAAQYVHADSPASRAAFEGLPGVKRARLLAGEG